MTKKDLENEIGTEITIFEYEFIMSYHQEIDTIGKLRVLAECRRHIIETYEQQIKDVIEKVNGLKISL